MDYRTVGELLAQVGNASAKLRDLGWFSKWRADDLGLHLWLHDGEGRGINHCFSLTILSQSKIEVIWMQCETMIKKLQVVRETLDKPG